MLNPNVLRRELRANAHLQDAGPGGDHVPVDLHAGHEHPRHRQRARKHHLARLRENLEVHRNGLGGVALASQGPPHRARIHPLPRGGVAVAVPRLHLYHQRLRGGGVVWSSEYAQGSQHQLQTAN
eukprot:408233-Pyramimonas_sp.AAC.2